MHAGVISCAHLYHMISIAVYAIASWANSNSITRTYVQQSPATSASSYIYVMETYEVLCRVYIHWEQCLSGSRTRILIKEFERFESIALGLQRCPDIIWHFANKQNLMSMHTTKIVMPTCNCTWQDSSVYIRTIERFWNSWRLFSYGSCIECETDQIRTSSCNSVWNLNFWSKNDHEQRKIVRVETSLKVAFYSTVTHLSLRHRTYVLPKRCLPGRPGNV
jgi:hypothetical protein